MDISKSLNLSWVFLLVVALLLPRTATAQEPPPYQGDDSAQDSSSPPPDENAEAQESDETATVEAFQQELAPYGQWVTLEGYGNVWVPDVSAGWRPYTTGHWAYTDAGWAWVADESWGWAPFHYGRWYYDQAIGWGCLPGTVWAPAWVAWQSGAGYIGWAPLSPAAAFAVAVGVDTGAINALTPGYYTFVHETDILAPRVSTAIVASTRNEALMRETRNVTSYRTANNRVVCGGVSVEHVEHALGRTVPRVQISSLTSAPGGKRGAFYQPKTLSSPSRVARAEFGKALPRQVAAQKRLAAVARTQPGRSVTKAPQQHTAGSHMLRSPATASSQQPRSAQPTRSSAAPHHAPSQPTHSSATTQHTPSRPTHPSAAPQYTPSQPTHSSATTQHTPSRPTHSSAAPQYTPSQPTHSSAAPQHTPSQPTHSSAAPQHTPSQPRNSVAPSPTRPPSQPSPRPAVPQKPPRTGT